MLIRHAYHLCFFLLFVLPGFGAAAHESAEDNGEDIRLADVAGEYWLSDGGYRSWNLVVREDGTFTSTLFSGDRLRDARQPQEGVASTTDGLLGLVVPPGDEFWLLRPVRLQQRLYLVIVGHEDEFCKEFLEGREPRRGDIGRILLRRGDWYKPVSVGMRPSLCVEPTPPGPPPY
jgi:hypothetical protein